MNHDEPQMAYLTVVGSQRGDAAQQGNRHHENVRMKTEWVQWSGAARSKLTDPEPLERYQRIVASVA